MQILWLFCQKKTGTFFGISNFLQEIVQCIKHKKCYKHRIVKVYGYYQLQPEAEMYATQECRWLKQFEQGSPVFYVPMQLAKTVCLFVQWVLTQRFLAQCEPHKTVLFPGQGNIMSALGIKRIMKIMSARIILTNFEIYSFDT